MRNILLVAAIGLLVTGPGRALPPAAEDPVALLRGCLAARDDGARAACAGRLASHPDYRSSRLRSWLHASWPYPSRAPGLDVFSVDVGRGLSRRVALIVPEGYRPGRPLPLIYALHPSGVASDDWAREVERMLGARSREFLIASPEFEVNYIFAKPPFVPEHPAILDAVARRVHVAADRVYALGYSKGGFAAWFVALYYSDRLAGAISMAAGFDVAPGEDGLWKALVGNVANTPVMNAWGEADPLRIPGLDEKPGLTFAESNRLFDRGVRGMNLPIVNIEVPASAHTDLVTPAAPLFRVLQERRRDDPRRVAHVFRHLHEASCYWLEGLSWTGEAWDQPLPAVSPRPGESASRAIARTVEPLLGRLTGTIDGQSISVTREHIGDLVVWLGERTIDWNRSISVRVDGREVFSGRVTPDVGVALARAQSTMDLDALRFAGIRVDPSGGVSMVTAASMPEPAWRTGLGPASQRRPPL